MTAPNAEYVRLVAEIDRLHKPHKEEAERWPDDGMEPPVLAECIVMVEVCNECGYDHDDGYPVFRAWPCPTYRAAHIDGSVRRDRVTNEGETSCISS